MSRGAQGAASRTFKIVMNGLLWSLLLLLTGCGIGVAFYFVLKRIGLIEARWRWYGYVRWLWMVLCIVSLMASGAYAGFWIGAGRELKWMLVEERLIDRIAANVLLAGSLDSASLELADEGDVDRIIRQFEASEPVGDLARKDFGKAAKPVIRRLGELVDRDSPFQEQGWGEKILLRLLLGEETKGSPDRWQDTSSIADEDISSALEDRLEEVHPEASILFFAAMAATSTSADEYVKTHPGASIPAAVFGNYTARLRQKALRGVKSLVNANVAIATVLGLVLILLPVGVFCGVKFLVGDGGDPHRAVPGDVSPGGAHAEKSTGDDAAPKAHASDDGG
jgi:hypothetical protein